MIINILKDLNLYKNLEKYNSVIRQVSSKYIYKHGADPSKGEATNR